MEKWGRRFPYLRWQDFLVLIRGIVLLVSGILEAINVGGLMDLRTNFVRLGSLTGIVVGMLVGILALVGSREVANPAWSFILLILGLFVGSLGGILVFIGGLIGLVSHYVFIGGLIGLVSHYVKV